MKAMILDSAGTPLKPIDRPDPMLGVGESRPKVEACAVCRTDLHVVDGDLRHPKLPLVPGHEIVGIIDLVGEGVARSRVGRRAGVPWLGHTCGHCPYCVAEHENLCDQPDFTGYTRDGGFASHVVADARFAFDLDSDADPVSLAPLLCAGLIGWRCLKKAGDGKRLGIYGVAVGDELLVRAGELLPVDGILLDASASLDESAVTGEPLPERRTAGDILRSGTLNAGESFSMRASGLAEQSTYAAIVRMVAVVVKLLSKAISHKSDIGGVVLNLATAAAAGKASRSIEARVRKHAPQADIEGYAVQPMVARKQAQELILGMNRDPIFGPAILFGAGGIAVEVTDDTAIALPPLDDILAGDLIGQTRVGRLLAGFRDRKPANRQAIVAALNGLSQMIVDFPCLVSMDINPLLADAEGVIALDARIEIEPERVEEAGPNPALAIRPYPSGWEKEFSAGGTHYHTRPIKPADIALYPEFLARISPADLRLRFLSPRKCFSDQMLKRFTQLDYDRNMAFVALETSTGALAGISRLSCDPDRSVAEYALLVRTDLQGHGLGWELLRQLVDYAKADGIGRIEGIILSENTKMLAMCREFGFSIGRYFNEPGLVEARLELR